MQSPYPFIQPLEIDVSAAQIKLSLDITEKNFDPEELVDSNNLAEMLGMQDKEEMPSRLVGEEGATPRALFVDGTHQDDDTSGAGATFSADPSISKESDLVRICSEELVKVSAGGKELKNIAMSHSATIQPSRPDSHIAPAAHSGPPCPYESGCAVAKECRTNAGRCGLMPTKLAESYYGYVETVEDAVMIVEACRFGRLMRVKRRLLEKERQGIRSGSVFVFVERESGIRRWTDGKVWSPSRICGEFLIYRELESRQAPATRKASTPQVNWTEQVAKILAAKTAVARQQQLQTKAESGDYDGPASDDDEAESNAGSLVNSAAVDSAVASIRMALAATANHQAAAASSGSSSLDTKSMSPTPPNSGGGKAMIFKRDGLIKKTISLTVSDETYHLICYFKDSNLGSELLHLTPSRMAAFKNLDMCRNPVSYPIMMLQPGQGMSGGTTNPIPPPPPNQQNGSFYGNRIMSNGQYISVPQAYMSQYMSGQQVMHQHQHHQQQQQQQHSSQYGNYANAGQYASIQATMATARRLAPQQPTSIANGSVQLPPVFLKNSQPVPTHNRAGLASLLADSAASMQNFSTDSCSSQVDMENIQSSCATNCNQACNMAASCSKKPPQQQQQGQVDSLEEEQLLFCHFVKSINDAPKE